jgi:hypothetical protein
MAKKPITLTAASIDLLAVQEPFKLLAMLENKQTHDHVWQLVSDYGAKCLYCSNPADGVDGKCMFHSQDDLSAALCVDCADPVIAESCPCEHKGIDGLEVSE